MRGKFLLLIALISFIFSTAGDAQIDGDEILKSSDQRLIPHTCSYKMKIITTDERGKTTESLLEGYKKGSARNLMVVKKPERLAGSVHLRKDEVIWSYYTTNHRLLKVAYQSIFMGSLLNYGDVLGTELSFDYYVVETEATEESYILTLNPREGQTGYAKVKVYIDKETMLPQKREYYAVSGILMKECEFRRIQMEEGFLQRMEQVFYEPLKEKESIVLYEEIQILDNIPDTYFNEQNLKYFGGE